MKLEKSGNRVWLVLNNHSGVAAEIHLDYLYQVDGIIFRTNNEKLRRRIKELVLSHAVSYQRSRVFPVFGGILTRTIQNNVLTWEDSDILMDFRIISKEVKELSDTGLDIQLGRFPLFFVDAHFASVKGVLDKIVKEIRKQHGIRLSYTIAQEIYLNSAQVRFHLKGDRKFRIWKKADVPRERYDPDSDFWLHITPSYHPCLAGAISIGLINGDTDAFIGQHELGLDNIYCPDEAIAVRRDMFSSWARVSHPFYAEGEFLGVRISCRRILSLKGYELLFNTILAALNLNKTYISVSGGFRSPYPYPQRPRGFSEVRGSEHTVVWEYRTLEKEGKLPGSLIPSWFFREGWLEAHEFIG